MRLTTDRPVLLLMSSYARWPVPYGSALWEELWLDDSFCLSSIKVAKHKIAHGKSAVGGVNVESTQGFRGKVETEATDLEELIGRQNSVWHTAT